jgi:hypothetical protein
MEVTIVKKINAGSQTSQFSSKYALMWTDDSCAKGKMNITILPYGKFKKGTIT